MSESVKLRERAQRCIDAVEEVLALPDHLSVTQDYDFRVGNRYEVRLHNYISTYHEYWGLPEKPDRTLYIATVGGASPRTPLLSLDIEALVSSGECGPRLLPADRMLQVASVAVAGSSQADLLYLTRTALMQNEQGRDPLHKTVSRIEHRFKDLLDLGSTVVDAYIDRTGPGDSQLAATSVSVENGAEFVSRDILLAKPSFQASVSTLGDQTRLTLQQYFDGTIDLLVEPTDTEERWVQESDNEDVVRDDDGTIVMFKYNMSHAMAIIAAQRAVGHRNLTTEKVAAFEGYLADCL